MSQPKQRPTSEAKTRANQQNAKRSTGPRTAEGKAVSSHNATTHGCFAGLEPIAAGPFRESAEEVQRFFTEIVTGLAHRDRLELEAAERIARVLLQFRRLAALDGVLLTAAAATSIASVGERRRRRDRQALLEQLRDWLRDAASPLPRPEAEGTPTPAAASASSPPPYLDTVRLLAQAHPATPLDRADPVGRNSSRRPAKADEPLIDAVRRRFGDLEAAASWAEHQYDELVAETADAEARARHAAAERCLAVMERTSKLGSRLSLELDRAWHARTMLIHRTLDPPHPPHRSALPGDHSPAIPAPDQHGETKPTPPASEPSQESGPAGQDQD